MHQSCNDKQQLDIQGHRGARGLMPENSIPSFISALDLGVTTLEMDVVISKDGKVVVSHDPYLSSSICVDRLGNRISPKEETTFNLYRMDYAEITNFDCGSIGNSRFPSQKKIAVNKPLLTDVIETVEAYIAENNLPKVRYNIELKSSVAGDEVFHPSPANFSYLVYQVVDERLAVERVTIQSFDERILKFWHQNYPAYELAILVEDKRDPHAVIASLGFRPEIYSPSYDLLTEAIISELHDKGMKVIPWTINEREDMEQMVAWKVDGIITDYPDRAIGL